MGEAQFIKGFKLDHEKLRRYFPKKPDESELDWELKWFDIIIQNIPRDAYIELETSAECDDEVAIVIVLDKGDDRERLEKEPIRIEDIEDWMFAQIAENLLTPGVWPSS